MQPERLREISDQAAEAHRSLTAGDHRPRDRAFRAVCVAGALAVLAGLCAAATSGQVLVEAIRPQNGRSLELYREILGEHGRTAVLALSAELLISGLVMALSGGIAFAASIMEHLWVGSVLKWSMVPAAGLLLGSGLAFLLANGHVPNATLGWILAPVVPAGLYLGVCLLYIPAFRRDR